ncbi:MAG: hypothetical protein AAGD38_21765 [Acidobacteriota bacterium]
MSNRSLLALIVVTIAVVGGSFVPLRAQPYTLTPPTPPPANTQPLVDESPESFVGSIEISASLVALVVAFFLVSAGTLAHKLWLWVSLRRGWLRPAEALRVCRRGMAAATVAIYASPVIGSLGVLAATALGADAVAHVSVGAAASSTIMGIIAHLLADSVTARARSEPSE